METFFKHESAYGYGNLVAVPYPPDTVLAASYLRFQKEGLLQMFYHEWDRDPTVVEFLTWCMEPGSLTMAVHQKRSTDPDFMDTIGIGKITPLRPMGGGLFKVEVAEMFFRQYQKRTITIPASSLMIEYVFDKAKVHTIFGTTPEPNRAALAFMKAIGFEHLKEPIPAYTSWKGQPCGAYVSWLTAEHWLDVRPFPPAEVPDSPIET